MELLSGKLCFDGGEFGAGGVDALLETLFHSGVPGGGHGGLGIGDLFAVLSSFGVQLFEDRRVDSRGRSGFRFGGESRLFGRFCLGFHFCFGFRLRFFGESGLFGGAGFCLRFGFRFYAGLFLSETSLCGSLCFGLCFCGGFLLSG